MVVIDPEMVRVAMSKVLTKKPPAKVDMIAFARDNAEHKLRAAACDLREAVVSQTSAAHLGSRTATLREAQDAVLDAALEYAGLAER